MIAETIIEQLGGGQMCAMLGVKHIMKTDKAAHIRFAAKSARKINHIEVELNANDEYTVKFWQIRKTGLTLVNLVDAVQASELRRVIESETGLRLSL